MGLQGVNSGMEVVRLLGRELYPPDILLSPEEALDTPEAMISAPVSIQFDGHFPHTMGTAQLDTGLERAKHEG